MKQINQSTTLAFSLLITLSQFSQAQGTTTAQESPDTSIPYESGDPEPRAREDRWSDFLPIWGAQAREQG